MASGELPAEGLAPIGEVLRTADLVIAADGGLVHCATVGVWPAAVIGDLDSAPSELLAQATTEGVEVMAFPADKDATDLELALTHALDAGASELTVVAAFGGRIDHELATIAMLASDKLASVRVVATDGRRHLWVVRDQILIDIEVGRTVSLVPWGRGADGVTTTGLQWPLDGATLAAGSTWGVSNVVVAPNPRVQISDGVLLVVADRLT